MSTSELRGAITALDEETAAAAARFTVAHEAEVESWRGRLSDAIRLAKTRLRQDVDEISGGNPLCLEVVEWASDYIDWLQWSLWDLPYLAVAVNPEPARFQRRIAACATVYFAGRIIDDVVDRHFSYKTRRPTMLSVAAQHHPSSRGAEGLTILMGLLLCADGILALVDPTDDDYRVHVERLLQSFRRTVVGAIAEHSAADQWSPESYERLVQLKNVDFWRCLYTGLDARRTSPLYPFLERYYALAQKINDLQDFAEDLRRGQPNFVALHLPRSHPEPEPRRVPDAVEEHLAAQLTSLAQLARELPPLERDIALLKLGEMLQEARRLGLFSVAQPGPAPEPAREPPLDLYWHSDLRDLVHAAGPGSLEEGHCAVCGGTARKRLFEKQGFTYHRCLECSHIYINPGVRLELQLRLGRELDHATQDDPFLDVQNIFAEPICHLLRLRARGPRLLDVGFGRGHIMRLARAYGFETYGIDSSGALIDELKQEFGWRVCRATLGVDAVPWRSFDVIVMSHVAEHLAAPGDVLKEIFERLSPGGFLYIAVPDMASLQFRLFGKNWDVISPLAHLQYFDQASLSRLLERCGFVNLERIQHPALPVELTPKWMRLLRELGGDESGELSMLAQRPMARLPDAGGPRWRVP